MSDADVAEILKLPTEERLRLVELIWESLSTTPDAVPLSDAHRVAIDEELVGANPLKIPILGNTGCNFLKENYAPPGSLSETVAVVGALYWR